MKKSPRKLSLSRETLLALENPVLDHVGGGAQLTQAPTCETNCDCTYSCPYLCTISNRTHCL
jgi:hypothetical protein